MFAPLLAKPKTKPASQVSAQRPGQSAAAEPQILPNLFGNQAMSRICPATELAYAKLKIGRTDDPLEREADQVASAILRMPDQRFGSPPSVSTGGFDNGKSEYLHTKRAGTAPPLAPSIVHEVLRSPGHPLDSETRAFMEPRFGQNFSQVRLHTDQRAGQSARAINALAYSAGHHLVFGANQYSPTAPSSRHLIAHELAHFLQQRFAANSSVLRRQSAPDVQAPGTPVETTGRSQVQGHVGDDLAVKILELADKSNHDSALYKEAIRTSGPVEKRYVYRNSYVFDRLADILDLTAYDQCVALLGPDARGRVLAGMSRLKKKYGLGEISEDGARWTEDELVIADRNFSKMSKADQEMLHGLHLIRKNELPAEERHGKKFKVAGLTSGGNTMQLTQSAFGNPSRGGSTILHEAGHLIQQKQPIAGMEGLRASKTFTDMEAARLKSNDAAKEATKTPGANPAFASSVNRMGAAINALVDVPPELVQENMNQLNLAEGQADVDRAAEHSKPWLDAYDRLKEYARTVEAWATEKQKIESLPADIEKSFIGIVNKYRLNNPSFAPFTDYVAHSWPDKPQEFLVQCYSSWRSDPDYMRSHAPKLFEWFESGGYRGINKPTK